MVFEWYYLRNPTGLVTAVRQGCYDSVAHILESGVVHPNIPDHRGWTALHEAAACNQSLMVRALVRDERTNPDAVTHEDETALSIGIKNNASLELIKYLDRYVKKKDCFDLLTQACCFASVEVVEYFLGNKKIDVNRKPPDYVLSPLLAAIARGSQEMIEKLIDAGANVNFTHSSYGMPLPFAISRNCDNSIIHVLVRRGANINLPVWKPPLLLALERDKTDVALELLTLNADINVIDNKILALSLAVRSCNRALVKKLLSESSSEIMEQTCHSPLPGFGLLSLTLNTDDEVIISDIIGHKFSLSVMAQPLNVIYRKEKFGLEYDLMTPLAFLLKEKMHKFNDLSLVMQLHSYGLTIEPPSRQYFPPLCAAISGKVNEDNHLTWPEATVSLLLNLNVNVDYMTSFLPDALLMSILHKNMKILKMLLPYTRYSPNDMAHICFITGKWRISAYILEHMMLMDDYSSLWRLAYIPEIAAVLSTFKFDVPSLAIIARHRVRQQIKLYLPSGERTKHVLDAIDSLPIPLTLKNFLRFL